MDLGGELGSCLEIVGLFEKAGYKIETTAAQSSNQNWPGERLHQTIANALRSMLVRAWLPAKFWPYAFRHYLQIYNLIPHAGAQQSPYEICTGNIPDLSRLCTFGCRVYTVPKQPNNRRAAKLDDDSRKGVFLGFAGSMKNALYYDLESQSVQACQHIVFDEGMADLDPAEQPPNACALHMENTPDHLDDIILEGIYDADVFGVSFSLSLFESMMEVTFPLDAAGNPGFKFADCDLMHQAFIPKVTSSMHGQGKGKEAARRAACRKYNRAYIMEIEGQPILLSKDIQKCLEVIVTALEPPQSIRVLLAPERHSGPPQGSPLHLRMADLRRVCVIINTDPSDTRQASYSEFVSRYLETELIPRETLIVLGDWLPEEYKDPLVSWLEALGMMDEERGLKSFTRRTLKKLANWDEWDAAFNTQLDQHHEAGTFLALILRPMVSPSGGAPQILRIVWSNLVKPDGRRKCQACLAGSKRSAPQLRNYGHTYASCIEQPCQQVKNRQRLAPVLLHGGRFFLIYATCRLIINKKDLIRVAVVDFSSVFHSKTVAKVGKPAKTI
jgi:hypothetical protein